ncbi:MAG: PAS domain S-box protein [Anaerolineaceae bacterium]|nr:PAS domain S-box protein [Anaerolineaceae bacterium]
MINSSKVHLELLFNINRELVSTLDLQEVLSKVIGLSIENVGAERGTLIVLDDAQEPVTAINVYHEKIDIKTEADVRPLLTGGLAGWVLQHRKGVLLENTSLDDRWLKRDDDADDRTGPKTAVCVPLILHDQKMKNDKIVGILTIVHSDPHSLGTDHHVLIQAIADIAAVAVDNANLHSSLQAAQNRYQRLFNGSLDPILITDCTGKILEGNIKAIQSTGYKKEELPEISIDDLHDIDWNVVGKKFEELPSDKALQYETVMHLKGGKTLPIEVNVYKVAIAGEEVLQWVLRDISERKELSTLQDDLIAMIYHDLRAPLSNIISSLDMLRGLSHNITDPAVPQLFGIANRSAERLRRLINSLLDIYQLESGQSLSDLEMCQINLLVEEAVGIMKPMIENKNQMVKLELEDDLPSIQVDEDMIRRVILNLIENASKFMKGSGNIVIGSRDQDTAIQVWIQDTGQGIPENVQESIFEKFTRIKSPHTPKGIGLGLAFCKLAVEAHAGSLEIKSHEGIGSCFTITLPKSKIDKR